MTEPVAGPDLFPARLREARQLRGLNQADLAAKAGMPPASISHFEGGTRKPSFANLRRLAQVLDVTTDYLLGRVESPGLGVAADPLYRHVENLSDGDRDLVKGFIEMLASRAGGTKKAGDG
ncbi:helix-turn-helix domain-containing protein [Leptolyngbya sp. 15MV]|nr:helix-turn-helix domain-containing protein [Leptolyngbya sp. 15MV]